MLITNCRIITWGKNKRLLFNHAILIKGDKIVKIGDQKSLVLEFPDEAIYDAQGKIVMPGLICSHTHFYSAFSRGLAIPGPAPIDFSQILQKLWWPLDRSLTLEDVKYSTLVSLIDAIKHGTTTLFDHHASPNCIDGSLDMIKGSLEASGVRGVICYEVTDRDGKEKADLGISENLRMMEKVSKKEDAGLVKSMFGLHASLTLSDETLEKCAESAKNDTGFHIHVAEHQVDEYDSLYKSSTRVTQRLNKYNLLGENSIIAHGVHLDMSEMDIIKDTNTWISHQPRSNMNNAVGIADVESMANWGMKVCLGNDGFSNVMWDEYRTCYLVHKAWNKDPQKMNGSVVEKMLFDNNAELATHLYKDSGKIGMIEEGAQADLIVVDYQPFTEMTPDNLAWHIQFGFRDSMVISTMVAGKWLMRDRELLTLDEQEINQKAYHLSKNVWERYKNQF